MPPRTGLKRRTLLLGSAAALTACTLDDRGGADARPPGGCAPLAVKVDNVGPARPHTGLEQADIIHVEQVESGLSRLLALYSGGGLPQAVGPVRSARETDLELLRQYGRPVLAYSGAQGKLQPLIDAAPLTARTPGSAPGAYYRDAGRRAPHNLYLRPARLTPRPASCDPSAFGLRFGRAPRGGEREIEHTVRYPSARFTFSWSADRARWRVAMDGGATPLAPATVVVQYAKVRDSRFRDRWGNASPFTETVGSGRAVVLRDGRAHTARWERPTPGATTSYLGADGEPLAFAEGQVWVVYAAQ